MALLRRAASAAAWQRPFFLSNPLNSAMWPCIYRPKELSGTLASHRMGERTCVRAWWVSGSGGLRRARMGASARLLLFEWARKIATACSRTWDGGLRRARRKQKNLNPLCVLEIGTTLNNISTFISEILILNIDSLLFFWKRARKIGTWQRECRASCVTCSRP